MAGGDIAASQQYVHYIYWRWSTSDPTLPYVNEILQPSPGGDKSFGLWGSKWPNTAGQYNGKDFSTGETAYIELFNNPLLTQYFDPSLTNLPSLGSQISEQQVAWEVEALAQGAVKPFNGDDLYVIFLPPGYGGPNGCAEHLMDTDQFFDGPWPFYAWVAYPDTVSGCWQDGNGSINYPQMQQATIEEMVEAASDPETNDEPVNFNTESAWRSGSGECEMGDVCVSGYFSIQVGALSEPNSGQVQTEQYYSNEASSCVYGRSTNALLAGIGGNNALWVQYVQPYDLSSETHHGLAIDGWTSWGKPSGVTLIGKPGVIASGVQRFDVFDMDSTYLHMWHYYVNTPNATSYWEEMPAQPSGVTWTMAAYASSPDAVSWGSGNTQMFAVGETSQPEIWRITEDSPNGWSAWEQIASPPGTYPDSKISVGSWMSTGIGGGAPTQVQAIALATTDPAGHIWFGTLYGYNTAPTWYSFTPSFSVVDVDIGIMSPGRAEVFARDTSGVMHDCWVPGGAGGEITGCSNWGEAPGNEPFINPPGAVGLGDGRLLLVGVAYNASANAYESYTNFWDWSGATGWELTNGSFVGGVDVASW